MDLLVTTETERAIARDYVMECGSRGDRWVVASLASTQMFWMHRYGGTPPTWIRLVQGIPAHFIW